MSKIKLYEIAQEFEALNDLVMLDEGEISETTDELNELVEHLLKTKTDGCCDYLRMLEDEIAAAKNKINDFKKFIDIRKNAIESYKGYIHAQMDRLGVEKFVGEFHAIKKRKPSKELLIHAEADVPLQFLEEQPVKILRGELKKYLQSGEKAEGCELVNGKASLKFGIKSKKD